MSAADEGATVVGKVPASGGEGARPGEAGRPQRFDRGGDRPVRQSTPAFWLVAEREITTRLRSKAFLISTGILMLLVLGGVLFAGLAANGLSFGGPTKVAVVGEAPAAITNGAFEVSQATDPASAEQLVRDGVVDAAVVPGGSSPVGLQVIANDSPPLDVLQVLSASPEVVLLSPSDANPLLAYFIAIGFGIVFMMSALTFGTTIAQSVVEEKQTRIVEILLATVTARTLLAGKILGNSLLALSQVVLIVLLAAGAMVATGQNLLLGELGGSLAWFAVLFAFGFVLLATLYAALASLVSRQEDIGSATSPVMMLVMLPYVGVIVFHDNAVMLTVMSYVPFSAPVGMPMRLYTGAAAWWEPFLTLAVLVVAIAVVLWIASRIYSASILRTGGRVKLSEALTRSE